MTADFLKFKEEAVSWIEAWNSGDLSKLMDHYADNVVLYSSAAIKRWSPKNGCLVGKKELKQHFRHVFNENSEMKLRLNQVLFGPSGILLIYHRETGKMAADLVKLNDQGKVREINVFNETIDNI